MGESKIKSQSNLDETLALALDINSTSLLNKPSIYAFLILKLRTYSFSI
ncbi:conserved hypothetical protein [Vibrio diabolicus]|nr:conserved hypothetical protein [Vibrio diabolicus]